ncbi:MAG TPA: MFS transporter [Longimicrobiales bacterium]|nr:MFS transporter [Longimicrobiales bacterium]
MEGDTAAGTRGPGTASAPTAWSMLALLSVAELLGMSLWFTASAVSPQLSELWSLSPSEAGWLTTVVQLGFVAGTATAAVLNLADIFPSRYYFAVCALGAALANLLLLAVPGYAPALVLRFATGLLLAGVYPPAMKMIATWFRTGRGFAIGTIVGALTVGKAAPYLVSALGTVVYTGVIVSTSLGAVAAAALVAAFYRDGPEPFERRPFSWGLVGTVARDARTRLAVGGYLGHMWELYAGWAAFSMFFYDFFIGKGFENSESLSFAAVVAFGGIAIGGLGSVLAGSWADRLGRENVASGAMMLSGACALTIGWLMAAPVWMVVSLALVWGFTIVADSAQFSALVTEVSPQHAVGTALTLQTSVGFLLSAFSVWMMIEVETRYGWGVAFSLLAVGPAFGIWQMIKLRWVRNK